MPHLLKAWIVNHCVEVGLVAYGTDAKKWQAHIHRRYRKWFGLAKSAEASILYRKLLFSTRKKSQRKMHHIYFKQQMIGNVTLIYLNFALLALPMFFLMLCV